MESREEEEEDTPGSQSQLRDEDTQDVDTSGTAATAATAPAASSNDDTEEEKKKTGELVKENPVAMAATGADSADEDETEEETSAGNKPAEQDFQPGAEDESEQKQATPTRDRPGPPSSLPLLRPTKKKVLVAPPLSLSIGRSESTVSEDFPSTFLSPSPEDDDTGLDFDLDAMETPSDTESLPFPLYDPDLEDDLQRLGMSSHRRRPFGPRHGSGSLTSSVPGMDLEREDVVDSEGIRWRCFLHR
ncbi:hypothetical protein Q5P01_018879 [Channa striata]|uniref:Uncharacterized protein n=1 Tax=Channa striata TaxID=64152 RepID=A0AA88SEJ3_CHASR|nr:hypothetical protein Q5P01_018879 [Channa striata]